MQDIALSQYGLASTTPSPVSRMMASFANDFREDVDINLGVGYVNEATIPRDLIQQALADIAADPQRYRAPFNYGDPAGSANLLAALRRFYVTHHVGNLTEADLADRRFVVGASGATSLLDAASQVLRPGIVITSDPIYYIYCNQLERAGFDVLAVPEDDRGIEPSAVRAAVSALGDRAGEISFIYVVTVGNPSCTILPDDRRRELLAVARDLSRQLGRAVPVLFDTAYELLLHDPDVTPPSSPLKYDEQGLAYELGTLSKIMAPTLRIGYMIGRDGPFLQAMVQKVSDTGFSAPLVTQEIASRLLDQHARQQIDNVCRGYRDKAIAVRGWIDQYLGDAVESVRGGQAGFYFYLTLRDIETHEQSPLYRYLSRTTGDPQIDGPPTAMRPRVIYIPGEFCVSRRGRLVQIGRRQLRISYGFESLPRIEQALKLMGEAIEWARQATTTVQ